MNTSVVLMISAALVLCSVGVLPGSRVRDLSRYERFIACYVLLVVAWPLAWTYLAGPLLWSEVTDFNPALWFFPALAAASGYFIHTLIAARAQLDIAALLQFSLIGVSAVLVAFDGLEFDDLVHVGSAAVLLLPTLVKPVPIRMAAIAVGCRISVLLIIASVWIAVIFNSAVTLEACRADKCSIAGQVVTSPFSENGNLLGLSLALLLPFVIYERSSYRAVSLVIGMALCADLAGSRTAEAGIVLAVVLATAVWAWPSARRSILIAGLAAGLLLSRIPAVIPFNDEQFTFRAILWNEGRQLFAQNPIFGSGPFAWTTFGESSVRHDANYSPHNGWLDVVVSIGLSGLVVMLIAIALKVLTCRHADADVLLLYFAILLTLSTLESVYVPYSFGIVPFACVLPFLVGGGRRVANHPQIRANQDNDDAMPRESSPGR